MDNIQKIQWLKDNYNQNNYKISEINLIGIRDSNNQEKDVINDYLGFWSEDKFFICKGTTEPGVYWVKDKTERNKQGTFHLLEGFHEAIWCFGTHKGYEALTNTYPYCKPTKGWRDANYDFTKNDKDIIVCDYFGINFHRMHPLQIVDKIGKYSAGCQVVQDSKNFEYIKSCLKNTKMYHLNNKVTYNYMLYTIDQIPKEFIV
jgi:hypothetical protein